MFNNNTELEVRNKLTILMLIHELKVPLTNEEITTIILDAGLMNYISMQHYITELCELSMLERIPNENKNHYLLTENGRVSLDFFKARIPSHTQNKVISVVNNFNATLPVETIIQADYTKTNDTSYEVHLSISENKEPMMSISLTVMSDQHAEQVCKIWQEKASYQYGDILALLTQEQ